MGESSRWCAPISLTASRALSRVRKRTRSAGYVKAATAVVAALRKYRGAAARRQCARPEQGGRGGAASGARGRPGGRQPGRELDVRRRDVLPIGRLHRAGRRDRPASGRAHSELDNRLYCYPALLNVVPSERLVTIDKKRERRVRPTVLVGLCLQRCRSVRRARAQMSFWRRSLPPTAWRSRPTASSPASWARLCR